MGTVNEASQIHPFWKSPFLDLGEGEAFTSRKSNNDKPVVHC